MTPGSEAAAVPAVAPSVSPAYRSYVVWLLFLIAVVNYFDRQIINILAEQIKHDLHLADWQLGLLTGLAFAALYTVFGVPVALVADRSNRARIVAGSLAAWSLFTATCGLAQNFTQLLLSRLLVGLGEAGCQPPSLSLVSEYAPLETRSKAMGVYALGIPAGSLVALTVGGILSENFGWRAAFLIAGVPGLVLALVAFLTLRDPRSGAAAAREPARSVGSSFGELRSNRVFWWLSLGSASMALVSYGQLAFFGSFFLRVHKPGLAAMSQDLHEATGLTLGPVGLVGVGLGVVIGLAGLLGAFLGGQLGQTLANRTPSALMWTPAIAAPLCVPFYIAAFLAPSAPAAFLLLFVPKLIGNIWLAPTFAALQSVVPPDVRATASAVQSSVVLFIGLGLGPMAVGAASDGLSGLGLGEAEGVRWALVGTSSVCLLAALFFILAARAMRTAKLS